MLYNGVEIIEGHMIMVKANPDCTFFCAVFTKLFAALDKQRCILYTNS